MKRLSAYVIVGSLILCGSGTFPVAASGSVATPFVNGVFRALIIGNNAYKDPEGMWPPLKTPINDAEAIAALLKDKYGFNTQHIMLLKNATRADILSAFSKLAKVSQENDSIFIYYAGHGYADPDTKEAFWIPVDGVGKEDYTYVRNSTIKSKLTVVADHAKHVFMVSDSCFSGTLLREGHRGLKVVEKTDKYYRKVAQKKSVQILAAGGLEYVDDNYKDTGHSPFTYYLMEHLKQTPERYLSATDISLEVARAVSKNVYQTPEKGVLHGAGDSNGEFFFLGPDSQPAPKPVPQAPAKRGQKAEKFDAEAEMWALVKDSDKIDDIKAFLAAFPSGKLSPVANLKLQQLERTQTRGEPAQTRDKPLVAAIPDTKPQRQGVPLAFFPCKFKNNGKRAFGKSIKVLSKMLQNAERIGEVYSYYPLSLGFNAKSIGQSLDPKELWDKGSLFSRPKPNMERVCQKAKEFGVQVVFMYFLDVIREGSTMVAYAIDVEKKAQYTAKASNVEWRLDGPRVTGNLTKKLFKDYFDNR